MVALEPDHLLILIALAALFLLAGIIAAVHYLYRILRRDARWPGLQNPYGWPADLLGDIDANVVDKSVCKKRLRPSRIERNAKKFHKALGDVLPEPDAPPVPIRVDSLTKTERQILSSSPAVPTKQTFTTHSSGGRPVSTKLTTVDSERRNSSGYRQHRNIKVSRPLENFQLKECYVDMREDSEPPPPYCEIQATR